MHEVVDAVTQGHKDGILEEANPWLTYSATSTTRHSVWLICCIIHEFGGVENLKGRKLAMTWAYSPSYGKPLSRSSGRCGPDDTYGVWKLFLAHPEGYEIMPEVGKLPKER